MLLPEFILISLSLDPPEFDLKIALGDVSFVGTFVPSVGTFVPSVGPICRDLCPICRDLRPIYWSVVIHLIQRPSGSFLWFWLSQWKWTKMSLCL